MFTKFENIVYKYKLVEKVNIKTANKYEIICITERYLSSKNVKEAEIIISEF